MKRVTLFLFGVLAAIVVAPMAVNVAGGEVRVGISTSSAVNVAPGGGGTPTPATGDPLTSGSNPVSGPVCVALPIFAGSQGSCKPGQVEIPNDPKSGGAIIFYMKLVLKLINGLIGGIIILVLVVAGIQYITAAGDPANVKSAKGRITNAIIALVLYLMMFAILNFLIPGGVL